VNALQVRPATPAGPLLIPLFFSIALHLAVLAWLHPRGEWRPVLPQFDLSVRLVRKEAPVALPPAPPARRAAASQAPKPGPLPAPADPAPSAEIASQPLRMRIVANPADYGVPAAPGRPYAWPGVLTELPFPPEGILLKYPEEQLRRGVQGLVVVRLDIARSGMLEQVDIVCSAPAFDAAVLDALRMTRFRAPLSPQGPVPAWTLLEFAFLAEPPAESATDPGRMEDALAALQRNCRPRG
jgi:TonB family protein